MSDHATEALFREYCEKHHAAHLAEARQNSSVEGRMQNAMRRNPGAPDNVLLYDFIEHEFDCLHSGSLIVYMPEKYPGKRWKGKIILEAAAEDTVFFEFQIAPVSDFSSPRETWLRDTFRHSMRRIYNLRLAEASVIPFVQDYLFCERFMQRALITTPSRVMGSITTQALNSEAGQLLALRKCLLKE